MAVRWLLRGSFQAINESDMKLVPDVSTAFVDPFRKHKTLDVPSPSSTR